MVPDRVACREVVRRWFLTRWVVQVKVRRWFLTGALRTEEVRRWFLRVGRGVRRWFLTGGGGSGSGS